ncbi:Chromosomal replication initiator protein DnaA [Planctopirus ephydatiae]|uniref:Chromosomal replication initiator protein DnaA n=1 Tax=Planctopirus ephydatiae TaxID=2528019 RepID=A0A518GK02_9PLAN|nr:chromosomal replication initiator protein DnaA [Planctopirus ephydatiae]QDV28920.1 Chromosomal replication initiator protein DnaA [Planctopirus ephydatiae]
MQPGMMLANPGINHDERDQQQTVQASAAHVRGVQKLIPQDADGQTVLDIQTAAERVRLNENLVRQNALTRHSPVQHSPGQRPAKQYSLPTRANRQQEAASLGSVLIRAGLCQALSSPTSRSLLSTEDHHLNVPSIIANPSPVKMPAAIANDLPDMTRATQDPAHALFINTAAMTDAGGLQIFQEALIEAIGTSRYEMLFARKVTFDWQQVAATTSHHQGGRLVLRIEDEFLRNWLRREYHPLLERLARECLQASTISFSEDASLGQGTSSAKITTAHTTTHEKSLSRNPSEKISITNTGVIAHLPAQNHQPSQHPKKSAVPDLKLGATITTIPSPDQPAEHHATDQSSGAAEQRFDRQCANKPGANKSSRVLPVSDFPGANLDVMRSESAHNPAPQNLPLTATSLAGSQLAAGNKVADDQVVASAAGRNPLVSQMAGPRRGAYVASTAFGSTNQVPTAQAPTNQAAGFSSASHESRSNSGAASHHSAPAHLGRTNAAKMSRRPMELSDLVVGTGNELALAAARKVCDEVPAPFNPLYLFGNVGIGKTHLLEGISRQLRRQHPGLNVLMMTAEQFANCFTQALRDKTLPSFRQKFRNVDALLIDDVDFLDNTRVIREEFLHTFTELAERGRAIVLTADRHPKLLSKLGDELVTRFMSGLICRVEAPDQATRERIVQMKAARMGTDISEEALMWVAQKFRNNVRELEGALNCLHTWYTMSERRVGLATARQILADLERDCLKIVRLADIEQTICTLFGVRPRELKSSSRARTVSQPRMLAMFLARKHTQSAYQEIGQHFGGRNHSTVMAAEKKVGEWLDSNSELHLGGRDWNIRELMDTLEQQLLAS